MPFKSEKQRRFLWMNEPEVAREFSKYNTGGDVMPNKMMTDNDVTVTVKSDGGETVTYKSPKGMKPNMGSNMDSIMGMDTVPAWLTPGEHVVNKPAAMKYRGLLNMINADGLKMAGYNYGGMVQGYNEGGPVGQIVKLGNKTFQNINGIWTQVVAGRGGNYTPLRQVNDPRIVRQLDARAGSNTVGSGNIGQQPIEGGGLLDNITVPVGADKYLGDRRYTQTRDDGSYRGYQVNPQGVADIAAEHRQGLLEKPYADEFNPVAPSWESQQWYNQPIEQHKLGPNIKERQAGILETPYVDEFNIQSGPSFASEQERVAKERAAAEAAEKARRDQAYGIFQEDANMPPRPVDDDPQFDLAVQTAQRQTDSSFKYTAGETYNAPSREAANAWVQAGIVSRGAIFRLPNGVTGRAQ